MRFAIRLLTLVVAACGLCGFLVLAGCDKPGSSGTAAGTPTAPAVTAAPASPGTAAAAGEKRPKAVVDAAEFDFGVAEVGQEFEHTFTIRNVGDAPLNLVKGPPSCTTCTSFEVDKLELASGEEAHATVKWKVGSKREEFRQYAPVRTNDLEKPEIQLVVRGEISEALKILPGLTWNVQELRDNEPTEAIGTITSGVLDSFQVTSIESSALSLTSEVTPLGAEELKELKAKCGYTIRAIVAPGVPVGEYRQSLKVHTDLRGDTTFDLNIVAKRVGPLTIIGPHWYQQHMLLDLGTFQADKGMKVTLSMFVKAEEELKFLDVSTDEEARDVKVTLVPDLKFQGQGKRRYMLTFEVPPGSRPVVRTSKNPAFLEVKTNLPALEKIRFRLHYNALAALR
jgi:hypothetical protein